MIITNQFKIDKSDKLTSEYIESNLVCMGVEPLRWAIVGFDEHQYILDVSYEVAEQSV